MTQNEKRCHDFIQSFQEFEDSTFQMARYHFNQHFYILTVQVHLHLSLDDL
jgi:hypothetical protein